MESLPIGIPVNSFDASTAAAPGAGTAFAVPLKGLGTRTLAYQTSFGASDPSAISVAIQGSLDNSKWTTLATLTTVTGDLGSVVFAYKFVRAYETSRTGGTSLTVTLMAY